MRFTRKNHSVSLTAALAAIMAGAYFAPSARANV